MDYTLLWAGLLATPAVIAAMAIAKMLWALASHVRRRWHVSCIATVQILDPRPGPKGWDKRVRRIADAIQTGGRTVSIAGLGWNVILVREQRVEKAPKSTIVTLEEIGLGHLRPKTDDHVDAEATR